MSLATTRARLAAIFGIEKLAKEVPRFIPFKVSVGPQIRVTPGKRHAWFESSVGPVRKPI